MTLTDDELRATHDKLDAERGSALAEFKMLTARNKAYLEQYKTAKQALPRRPKDPKPDDDDGEVTA